MFKGHLEFNKKKTNKPFLKTGQSLNTPEKDM